MIQISPALHIYFILIVNKGESLKHLYFLNLKNLINLSNRIIILAHAELKDSKLFCQNSLINHLNETIVFIFFGSDE